MAGVAVGVILTSWQGDFGLPLDSVPLGIQSLLPHWPVENQLAEVGNAAKVLDLFAIGHPQQIVTWTRLNPHVPDSA